MADAGKCDTDIFENGLVVGIVTGADAHTIEAYVKCCAARSGQPMDWHSRPEPAASSGLVTV
jgi:hypothetical protein